MADQSQILKILLQVQADVADLQGKLIPGIASVKTGLDDASKSAFGLTEAFEFAGANELIHRLVESLKEIPVQIYEALKQGVEFNAELQKVQTSIAGLFKQEAPQQFATFEMAKDAAGETIDLLKKKANELGVAYTDMFDSFEHAQAQLAAGGVTNIQKQIDLIALLNRAMQALGVSSTMAARDIGDILQGAASRTLGGGRLAAAMGMSKEELDTWILSMREAGTLAQGLQDKLGGIAQSMDASSQTFNADVNRMHNAIFDLKAAAAGPIMEPLTQAMENFTSVLKDEDIKAWGKTVGDVLKDISDWVVLLIAGWQAMANAVRGVGTSISGLLAPLEAVISKLEANPILKSLFGGIKSGIAAAANAGLGSLGPLGGAIRSGIAIGGYLADTKEKEVEIAALEEKRNGLLTLQVTKHGESKKTLEEIKKLEDDIALKRAEASGDGEAIAQMHAKIAYDATLKAATDKLIPQKEAIRLAEQEREATLAVWQHRAAMKGAHEAHRDIQQQITEFTREEAGLLQQIRGQQQIISQNPFLSADSKNAQMIPLIKSEIAALNAEVAKGKQLIAGGALDPAQYQEVSNKVQQAGIQVTLLTQKVQALSFLGNIRADLTSWVNSFGTTAHQVASIITSTLGTAVGGLSNAITGLIFKTTTWKQAFAQAAQAIVQNIIQIALQWGVSRLLMSVLNAIFGKTDAQVATQAGAGAAAAWAPAATSASIATEGVAAGTGLAAYAAALGTGLSIALGMAAGASGAAAQGMYVDRGTHSTADDVPMRVSRGEGIINARAVAARGGKSWVDSINSNVSRPGYASGGYAGSSPSSPASTPGAPDTHEFYFFTDLQQAIDRFMASNNANKHFVRLADRNRFDTQS